MIAALLPALSGVASACSCAAPPPALEAMAAADVVFQGRVDAVEPVRRVPGDGQTAFAFGDQAVFEVEAWWKGGDARHVTVQVGGASNSCGLEVQPGQTWVIYGYRSDGVLRTAACTRSTASTEFAAKELGPPASRRALDPWRPGPLEDAISRGDVADVVAALQNGASPAVRTPGGVPFDDAVATCRPDLVAPLVEAGGRLAVDVFAPCPAGARRALFERLLGSEAGRAALAQVMGAAAQRGLTAVLLDVLDARVPASMWTGDPPGSKGTGSSPVARLLRQGHVALVSAVLARGVPFGPAEWIAAAASPAAELRSMVSQWPATPQQAASALDEAWPDPALITYLLSRGAGGRPTRAVDRAVVVGCDPCVALLVAAGATATSEGLDLAVQAMPEHVGRLLELGADPNVAAKKRVLPLHTAAMNGNVQVMTALLAGGADVNGVSSSGTTALFAAVLSLEAVELLLDAGADPRIRDPNGLTAADHAERLESVEVARELRSWAPR